VQIEERKSHVDITGRVKSLNTKTAKLGNLGMEKGKTVSLT
jgi:hypothetical protein